jgi:hypothetical protein
MAATQYLRQLTFPIFGKLQIIKTTILDYPAYWQAKQKPPVPAPAPTPK